MLTIIKHGVVLSKTAHVFEQEGVLNPAAIRDGDRIHLFYRAVSTGNFSTVGHCVFKDPLTIESRDEEPVIIPQFDYESHGVEDPRIVKIDNVYYLTYTAYDGLNALGALAISTDLVHFERKGLIVPQITYAEFNELANTRGKLNAKYLRYNEHERIFEHGNEKALLWDKNLILFPRKIKDQFCFLHRIKPDIQILVAVNNFEELTPEYWREYFLHFDENVVLTPKYDHEVSYIGGGCPPIETAAGWLMIYHGVHDSLKGYVYSACAALLDLEDPRKEIARLPYPLFKPELTWELKGEVNNVCFPTGSVTFDDTLYIYYGAADERIACASLKISELIEELLRYSLAPNVLLEVTPGFE